jgi:hypothetical protein
MVANTCIEAATRCAAELGYQVVLVRAPQQLAVRLSRNRALICTGV